MLQGDDLEMTNYRCAPFFGSSRHEGVETIQSIYCLQEDRHTQVLVAFSEGARDVHAHWEIKCLRDISHERRSIFDTQSLSVLKRRDRSRPSCLSSLQCLIFVGRGAIVLYLIQLWFLQILFDHFSTLGSESIVTLFFSGGSFR